ncbi:phage tail sheath subtilisin-like domain-containing protein [Acetobacter okinawensis]|uniref:phage tail sheath subtilisin-like domain-containing protein n=1 Tax=Acetobacter okinawensis TaxID=1076594 RepID=UPI0039E7F628
MSSIMVPGYSTSNRVPGFYLALDNTGANTASAARRILLIGQMLATGTGTPGVVAISGGVSDAIAKYGEGSQCHIMVRDYRTIDSSGEVWVLPLLDDAASQPAVGSFTLAGTATAAGTLALYVADQLVPVGVSVGDTAAAVAANVVIAAKGVTGLPVSVTADAGIVTVTALNKGLAGNGIQLGVSLLGTAGGQSIPSGLSVTIAQPSGGTQNPTSLATALASMGTRVYDLVAHPYTDTASLTAFKDLFDNSIGRWSPMEQLYGHHITALRGTYGEATTFGLAQNDPHGTVMPISDSPSSPMSWAAQLAAVTAVSMRENPALPVRGLALTVMPPTDAGRFAFDERNSFLHDGLATFTVDDSGTVLTERLVSTYQENASGVPDDSYLDIETLLTAQVCMQDMRTYLASLYGRYILVADGTKIPAGAQATTAQLISASAVARYRWQATQLWVQNPDTFASKIVWENAGGGQVMLQLPYDFSNQLWVLAADIRFTKS